MSNPMSFTDSNVLSWLTGAPLTATAQAALSAAFFPTADNALTPVRLLLFQGPGQGAAQAATAAWEAAYPIQENLVKTLWAGVVPLGETEAAIILMAENNNNNRGNSSLSAKEAAQLTHETLQAEYFLSTLCGISAPFTQLKHGETAFTQAQECLALATAQ
ncbi:MAG: hypothetical protein FWD16_02825, partial [Clostridia bacterium]|nr:hypothetical protein [Clostridia bacterium]